MSTKIEIFTGCKRYVAVPNENVMAELFLTERLISDYLRNLQRKT